jgi:hypothetical protein
MRTTDFTPLYRTIVGFDRLANMIDNAASWSLRAATHLTISNSCPSMNTGSSWPSPASVKTIWIFRFRKTC